MVVHHRSYRTVVSSNRSTKSCNSSHTRTSIHIYSDVGRTSNGWVDVVYNSYSLSASSSVTSNISYSPNHRGSSKWIDTRSVCSVVEVVDHTYNRTVVRSSRSRHSNVCSAKTSSHVSCNVRSTSDNRVDVIIESNIETASCSVTICISSSDSHWHHSSMTSVHRTSEW